MAKFSLSKDYTMHPVSQMIWGAFFTVLHKGIYNVKIFGKDNIPDTGAYILAPNHMSNFDPTLVAVTLKRPAYFMAKAELFKNPILRIIIQWLGSFPVHRGGVDKVAIRRAMDIIKRGDLLGIFPQGGRRKPGHFDKLHDGVASIALRTGTPIIPIAIVGSDTMRRGHVAVNIGKPIPVSKSKPTREAIEAVNKTLSETLASLYHEHEDILK